MRTLLVCRFSAFGDVVMSVKVIEAVLAQNPDCEIIFLSKKPFGFLFDEMERVRFIEADLNDKHKGFLGLWQLSKELKAYSPDVFLDIHNVLRTKLLRLFMRLRGLSSKTIYKGRFEKYKLIRKRNKVLKPLKNTVERYAEVFRKGGVDVSLEQFPANKQFCLSPKVAETMPAKNQVWIGLAPFSLHKQKTYPLERMKELIDLLLRRDFKVFIFGGGKSEKELASDLIEGLEGAESLIGRFSLPDELALISQMDLLLTMDSANMHLASLCDTKLLSVWGGTHPYAGFAPYNNPNYFEIQISETELDCRPCSVYGKTPCRRGDWACLHRISPREIAGKISEILA